MKKVLTLCLVQKGSKILLGYKKRGFGEGLWNGFGGKVKESEDIEKAALRELEEETGIKASTLKKYGILEFHFEDSKDHLEVHVFKVAQYQNSPKETEEMLPKWFALTNIPFDNMWKDDKYWLPLLIKDKKFRGKFHFSNDTTNLLSYSLNEVKNLP